MKIDNVGEFYYEDGYWECSPSQMNGSVLTIETEIVSNNQILIAQDICVHWDSKLDICIQYIEEVKDQYGLIARNFTNPNAFINSDTEWAIFFDTESELEAVIGVDFSGIEPFQLTIGD
ncbi:hypothetical protein [Shewanella baltica]|uniref:hypothetical protein n=1 Tax=Shewanella baltica TaxID=62322 RepID=UPI00217E5211|nr:hypothetical protein [Shewanella baltica]MCS6162332.1 hypothetical protein [Shewanella baltica]